MSPAIDLPVGGLRRGPLELRPVAAEDLDDFVDAFQDPGVADDAYNNQLEPTHESLGPYFARNPERMAEGVAVLLSILEDGAERLSGLTMLFRVDQDERSAELGFWVAPWARGRGVAVEAIRLTLEFGFGHLGLERIYANTRATNSGAQGAMERAGMQREGLHRGHQRTPDGRRLDQVSFGALSADRARA